MDLMAVMMDMNKQSLILILEIIVIFTHCSETIPLTELGYVVWDCCGYIFHQMTIQVMTICMMKIWTTIVMKIVTKTKMIPISMMNFKMHIHLSHFIDVVAIMRRVSCTKYTPIQDISLFRTGQVHHFVKLHVLKMFWLKTFA